MRRLSFSFTMSSSKDSDQIICVFYYRFIDFTSFYILIFDFGIVPTVCYFMLAFHFITDLTLSRRLSRIHVWGKPKRQSRRVWRYQRVIPIRNIQYRDTYITYKTQNEDKQNNKNTKHIILTRLATRSPPNTRVNCDNKFFH